MSSLQQGKRAPAARPTRLLRPVLQSFACSQVLCHACADDQDELQGGYMHLDAQRLFLLSR